MAGSFTDIGNTGRRGGLHRRNDVFSSGPLVLRCPWDISADFEDTAANQRKKRPAVPGVTNYAALCSLQPGRPLKDRLTIPLLGTYPEKTMVRKDTCIPMFITALLTTAKTWKQPKCPLTDEWIKKIGTYIQWNITQPLKKWNNAICSDMDGPGDYHTKWSRSYRERQISYDIAYMQNLKKWYKWIYLQNRNRLTDIENKLMVTKKERGGERN